MENCDISTAVRVLHLPLRDNLPQRLFLWESLRLLPLHEQAVKRLIKFNSYMLKT